MKKYYVYMILTERDTIYCGYTDNIEKRFDAHLKGKGAKYTRANKPVKIIYQKEFDNKSEAMKEEARLKKLSHRNKLLLSMIKQKNKKTFILKEGRKSDNLIF